MDRREFYKAFAISSVGTVAAATAVAEQSKIKPVVHLNMGPLIAKPNLNNIPSPEHFQKWVVEEQERTEKKLNSITDLLEDLSNRTKAAIENLSLDDRKRIAIIREMEEKGYLIIQKLDSDNQLDFNGYWKRYCEYAKNNL